MRYSAESKLSADSLIEAPKERGIQSATGLLFSFNRIRAIGLS
jgi:hypothetical protein